MGQSTLQHDEDTPPIVTKGHGTGALGPSDSSDSGSDVQGGAGLSGDDLLFSQAGDEGDDIAAPGADVGDANLDSDSDRDGTGERAAAGRDASGPTDTILRDENDDIVDGEALADDDAS